MSEDSNRPLQLPTYPFIFKTLVVYGAAGCAVFVVSAILVAFYAYPAAGSGFALGLVAAVVAIQFVDRIAEFAQECGAALLSLLPNRAA